MEKKAAIEAEIERLNTTTISPKFANPILEACGSAPVTNGLKLADMLRRPEVDYAAIAPCDTNRPELDKAVCEQAEISIKYDGYIKRQVEAAERFKKLEEKIIPDTINYDDVYGLRIEARQKLSAVRPHTLGQASRISGVSPADVTVLMIHLGK